MSDLRFDLLVKKLRSLDRSLVAFSGGVDSTFLVKAAHLSDIRFYAVTANSETMPRLDFETAGKMAAALGVEHRIIVTKELDNDRFTANSRDRCFHCKDGLFSSLKKIAEEEGYFYILDGSNADDMRDYRPGLKANEKHGVISPLCDAGLGKEDIRRLSRMLGLPTWDRPSSPCLSSRLPYGVRITKEALKMVALAEDLLRSMGFRVVRVRTSGTKAMIEVEADELVKFQSGDVIDKISEGFKKIGYSEILVDREGYRTGKLNNERYGVENSRLVALADMSSVGGSKR
jgi:uncharacterized protein